MIFFYAICTWGHTSGTGYDVNSLFPQDGTIMQVPKFQALQTKKQTKTLGLLCDQFSLNTVSFHYLESHLRMFS